MHVGDRVANAYARVVHPYIHATKVEQRERQRAIDIFAIANIAGQGQRVVGVANALASSKAYTVVGGGDSVAAINQAGEQVAKAMGTTQAVIARLESGRVLPSTRTLERFAKATRTRLRITFARETLSRKPAR